MKVKKLFAVLLALMLVGITQLNYSDVTAQTTASTLPMSVRPTVEKCDKCNATVIYYGYQSKYSGTTYNDDAGELCHGCNKIIPTGERHISFLCRDRYFFSCKCGYSFYRDADPVLVEHTVKYID